MRFVGDMVEYPVAAKRLLPDREEVSEGEVALLGRLDVDNAICRVRMERRHAAWLDADIRRYHLLHSFDMDLKDRMDVELGRHIGRAGERYLAGRTFGRDLAPIPRGDEPYSHKQEDDAEDPEPRLLFHALQYSK